MFLLFNTLALFNTFKKKYKQHSMTASHASDTTIFSIYILAFNNLILYYITGRGYDVHY